MSNNILPTPSFRNWFRYRNGKNITTCAVKGSSLEELSMQRQVMNLLILASMHVPVILQQNFPRTKTIKIAILEDKIGTVVEKLCTLKY